MSTNNLPEGWRAVRLGEVATFTRKPRGLDYSEFGCIPFVPMELVPIGVTYMNDHELREGEAITSGTYFEDGDVLLARITPSFENGKQVIIENLPEPFGVGTTEVIPFKAKHGVSYREYLFYFLLRSGVRNELAGKMEGSTGRQRLKPRTLKDLRIPLPSLPEQQAIADALKLVEDTLQARRRELEVERERKAALLANLFTFGTRGEPTKETEIGEVPQAWKIVRLGRLIAEGPQNGIYKPQKDYGEGTPILRINDFDNIGRFVTPRLQEVRLEPGEAEKYGLEERDIVINRVNSLSHLGKSALTTPAVSGAVFESNMMRIRLDEEAVVPEFIGGFLLSDRARAYFRSRAKRAVAQSSINQSDVKSLPVPVPSLDEQREIAEVIAACDGKAAALDREIELHEELFQALLEELMTGQRSALPLVDDGQEVAA